MFDVFNRAIHLTDRKISLELVDKRLYIHKRTQISDDLTKNIKDVYV